MTEDDIVYEVGDHWVLREKARYTVFVAGSTHSTSDSSYERTDDGLSLAKARCDYLHERSHPHRFGRAEMKKQEQRHRHA
mgnify:CR=1 FL=1